MRKIHFTSLIAVLFIFLFVGNNYAFASADDTTSTGSIKFVENKAQWEPQVLYRTHLNTGAVFFEKHQITFNFLSKEVFNYYLDRHQHDNGAKEKPSEFRSHSYNMQFLNASPNVEASGINPSSTFVNYIKGNDPTKWVSEVYSYNIIRYNGLYEGIDMKVYSSGDDMKYDFIVAAGKDPAKIAVRYEGTDGLHIEKGNLVITTSVNTINEVKPYAYQSINGRVKEVPCEFILTNDIVTYNFPSGFDSSYPLVIDPTLIFSTYTGSYADNWGFTATYDTQGNLYAGGIAFNVGYPITPGAFQSTFQGGSGTSNHIGCDVVITKFNGTGTNALYSTYIGGSSNEIPQSIIANDAGELFIFGSTSSSNFPVTAGAYSTTFKGGSYIDFTNVPYPNGLDIFVMRLNAAGTGLIASTFIGGTGNDGQNNGNYLNFNYADNGRGEIIIDELNNVYVASATSSNNFPVTPGAAQPFLMGKQDGVVFKLNGNLNNLLLSTYLGGVQDDAAYSLKLDPFKNIYVGGGTESADFPTTSGALNPTYKGGSADGFITRISNNGTQFLNSTFIGTQAYDQVYIIEIDSSHYIYGVGQTSGAYPVTPNVYNVTNGGQFISKLNPALSAFDFSMRFGKGDGNPELSPTALMVDKCNNIYFSGWGGSSMGGTQNTDLDVTGLFVTPNAFKSTTNGSDFYILILTANAAGVKYASYFGGSSSGDHVDGGTSRFDRKGIIYQAVCASCRALNTSDFPTTPGAFSSTDNSNNCNLAAFKFDLDLFVKAAAVANPDTVGCIPFNVQFHNGSTGATNYIWDLGDGTTSNLFAPVNVYDSVGLYLVRLIAIDSTCNISDTTYVNIKARHDIVNSGLSYNMQTYCDSAVVSFSNNSTNGSSYSWHFGDNNYSTHSNPVHVYRSSGKYTVQLITSNPLTCNLKDTSYVNITVNILPKVLAITDSVVRRCTPSVVNFNNFSTNATNYLWQFEDGTTSTDPNPVRTYNNLGKFAVTLIASNPNSCNLADTISIDITVVTDSVHASFTHARDSICDSLTVDLLNTSSTSNILWDLGDGTTSTLQDLTHKYYIPGIYTIYLIADDTSTCNLKDTIPLVVELKNRVTALAVDSIIACEPGEISFQNNSLHGTSFEWYFGNGDTSTEDNPVHTYGQAGSFNVTLVSINPNSCNLSDTTNISVTIHPTPVAGFSVIPGTDVRSDEEIQIVDESTGADYYLYTFGDGDSSTLAEPTHIYKRGGTYEICQRVTNEEGCEDVMCKTIPVAQISDIFAPTAFSPNADNINDKYKIFVRGIDHVRLRIFNRWGEMIYESDSLIEGWDGTYKGVNCDIGVYVYHLSGLKLTGEYFNLKGNITLLR